MTSSHHDPRRADEARRELDELEAAIAPRWSARRVLGVVLLTGGVAAAATWATGAGQRVPWSAVGGGPMDLEAPAVVEDGEIGEFLERHREALADDASAGAGQRHRGEEGVMGRPTSRNKSGLYAMKGPRDAMGVGGLGLVGTGRGGGAVADDDRGARGSSTFAEVAEHPVTTTASDAMSTFSIDVDTASYSRVRSFVEHGVLPPPEAVRIEELVNYFDYAYDAPASRDVPFSVHAEVGPSPWNDGNHLVMLGLKGWVETGPAPTRNLVFLVDVSGSMDEDDKLPLLVRSLSHVVDRLRPEDRVAMVVYAGASGIVLEPTTGDRKDDIRNALMRLRTGGSTNGGAGIELAYRLAERHFVEGGINRVVLATDGDFNVGLSDMDELERLITAKRDSGVFLSVLGFGEGGDATMEMLADKGNGNYAFIDGDREAQKVLGDELSSTLVTIAKDVKLQVELDADKVESWRLVGYDNRRLADRDFDDDTKDAGEIGAGHTVTAIYEVTPKPGVAAGDPLMKVALRFKRPDGDTSSRIDMAVPYRDVALADASDDFRFAAAVAEVGLLLRRSAHAGDARWREAIALAEGALGRDDACLRGGLVTLARRAAGLAGEPVASRGTSGRCTS